MSIMLQQKLEAWAVRLDELERRIGQPDGQPFLARLMAVEARLSKLEGSAPPAQPIAAPATAQRPKAVRG